MKERFASGGSNGVPLRPDGGPRFLSEAEEVRQRMAQLGTNDPAVVLVEALTPRLIALAQKTAEERAAVRSQARTWRERREALGLSLEEVAQRVEMSAFELGFVEGGFPPPEGISPDAVRRLDALVAKDGQP